MLFPKHNSNISAHQVILKSLKTVIIHSGEMQSISNFWIFDELSEYRRFVFKFYLHYIFVFFEVLNSLRCNEK